MWLLCYFNNWCEEYEFCFIWKVNPIIMMTLESKPQVVNYMIEFQRKMWFMSVQRGSAVVWVCVSIVDVFPLLLLNGLRSRHYCSAQQAKHKEGLRNLRVISAITVFVFSSITSSSGEKVIIIHVLWTCLQTVHKNARHPS